MKNIVFDLGMVLVDYRWRGLLEDLGYAEEKIDRIGKAVFKNALWNEFDHGVMAFEEIVQAMKKNAPDLEEDITRIFQNENFRYVCLAYAYSEELVKRLKEEGYNLYILSNYGERLIGLGREHMTFLSYFDGETFSYKEQLMKPEAAIYQALISNHNLLPEETVYFDDVENNCIAGRKAGLHSVEVNGLASILDGLKEYCELDFADMRIKYADFLDPADRSDVIDPENRI